MEARSIVIWSVVESLCLGSTESREWKRSQSKNELRSKFFGGTRAPIGATRQLLCRSFLPLFVVDFCFISSILWGMSLREPFALEKCPSDLQMVQRSYVS